MGRSLALIASCLALLLSIFTVVIWIRSYRVTTSVGYYAIDKQLNRCRRYDLTVGKGGFSAGYDSVTLAAPQEVEIWQRNFETNYHKSPGTTRAVYHLSLSKGQDPSASHQFFRLFRILRR